MDEEYQKFDQIRKDINKELNLNEDNCLSNALINRISTYFNTLDGEQKGYTLIDYIERNFCPDTYRKILKQSNLEKIELGGIPLGQLQCFKELILSDANFKYGKFDKLRLEGVPADFSNSNFENTSAKNSDFSNSVFRSANLRNSDFTNANLTYANLTNADLRGTKLDGAILYRTDFSGAKVSSKYWVQGLNSIIGKDGLGKEYVKRNFSISENFQIDNKGKYFTILRKPDKVYCEIKEKDVEQYEQFVNHQLKLKFFYPKKVFSKKLERIGNGHTGTIIFLSQNCDALLRVESQMYYGENIDCIFNRTGNLLSDYTNHRSSYDRQESRVKEGWYIRTGFIGKEGEDIIYEKLIEGHSKTHYLRFQLIHPRKEKPSFSDIIDKIEDSFQSIK